jgi:hypothetical protein
LEELEGVQAFVGRQIVLHTLTEEMPDREAIQAALAPFNLTIGEILRDDELLF